MKNLFFLIFRRLASLVSGYGLRDRYIFIDYIYKFINRFLSPGVTKVLGHRMYLDRDDSMALSINGVYEPEETRIVMEHVKPGDVVLDIGANIGYYTLILADLAGPNGKVYAFEPDPESFRLLGKNIHENNYENVELVPKAVSDQNREINLYRDRFNNLDHRIFAQSGECEVVKIEAIRLDDYFPRDFGPICFIKMDIQGAEGYAIEGMRKLLDSSKSVKIVTEFWPEGLNASGYGAKNYLDELEKMGFVFFDIGKGLQETTSKEITGSYLSNPSEHTNLLCIKNG